VLASMGQLMDALGVSVHEPRTAEPRAGYARVLDALGISQEPRTGEPPHGR